MSNEWTDIVKVAMDMVVAAAIVIALLAVDSVGHTLMRTFDNNQASAAQIQEYRVAASYEGSKVQPQDVANLVLENQGYPYVKVGSLLWSKNSASSQYSSIAVNDKIYSLPYKYYTCTLDWDQNGELLGYKFTGVS